MKPILSREKKNKEVKWYLVFDGKNHQITNDLAEYETLKGVVIEITACQAAAYLLMRQTCGDN